MTHRSIDAPWGNDYLFLLKKFEPLRTYEEIDGQLAKDHFPNAFKRIKIPLIRRLYPQLLWTNP